MGQAEILIEGGLTHTEGARWHEGRLWFSDLYGGQVRSCLEDGSDLRTEAQVGGNPSGLGWLPDGLMLVVSMERQTVVRREPDGTLVDHADLSPLLKGPWDHANDLVVAADGTAYVGSLGFHLVGDAPVEPTPIFRLSPDGVISVASEPLFFPNGASIVGGDTLVIAESFGNRLSAFDIRSDGSLSERRDWYAFGPRPEATDWREAMKHIAVAADGTSGPDTEGGIWVADFVRDRAVRIRPDRGIVDEVTVSGDLACYAVALGGADGRTLFLCATPAEFDPQIRRANPLSTIQSCRVAVPAADASVAS